MGYRLDLPDDATAPGDLSTWPTSCSSPSSPFSAPPRRGCWAPWPCGCSGTVPSSVSLTVVAAVAVTAMLAGTLTVAWAMFLSPHDLTVVTTVVAMAAAVSLATAMLLGRWVAARSRDLTLAARSFGDGGTFAAPEGQATAELAALTRELAATSAKLDELQGARACPGELAPGARRLDLARSADPADRAARHVRGAGGRHGRRLRAATCGRYAGRWSA